MKAHKVTILLDSDKPFWKNNVEELKLLLKDKMEDLGIKAILTQEVEMVGGVVFE